jgi:hypothetical protein
MVVHGIPLRRGRQGPPTLWSEAANRRYGCDSVASSSSSLPSHRPLRGAPARWRQSPAVYLAAARLVREHWDRHGLRSDLRHIGTAIEAGVVLVVPANSTWGIWIVSLPRYRQIPHHHPYFSPNAIVTGTLPPSLKRQVRSRTVEDAVHRWAGASSTFVCNAILSKQIASSSIYY